MNSAVRRLEAAVEVTLRAAARLQRSLEGDMALLIAAAASGDSETGDERLRAVDAFVQRFQQLHEHVLYRFYPAIYRLETFGDRPPPTATLLAEYEGLGIVDSSREWRRRTELRNRLVHEYPLEPEDRAKALAATIEQAAAMLAEIDRGMAYVKRKALLEGD